MKNTSKGGINMLGQALPVSEAKAKFSELHRLAGLGLEVVSTNKHHPAQSVSMIRADILTAALETMKFSLMETRDDELGVTTIAVREIPVYGEGPTREEAIVSLVEAALDYSEVYREKIELFSRADTPEQQGLMLKLMRCGTDHEAIKRTLGF